MRIPPNTPFLAAVLSLCAAMLTPQPAACATPDTARLRQVLAGVLADDFEIVRTELSSGLYERSGTFWLVHARPRRSGDYELRYRYDYRDHHRPENPLYTHVEHASYVRVGQQGCWRRREGKDVCLGDTVILPFVVNDYTGHTFWLTRRGSTTGVSTAAGQSLFGVDTTAGGAVPNPLSRHLRYLGSQSYEMLRRSGGGSVTYFATFQAVEPGRFNLAVTTGPSGASARATVPVLIVPRGEPVTVLLANETVVGTNARNGFSSHSGNQYITTPLLLQPGDRITLEYGSRQIPRRNGAVPIEAPVPLITRGPFHLDTDERFNAWIAPHLPPSSAPPND